MDKIAHFWSGIAGGALFVNHIGLWAIMLIVVIAFLKEKLDPKFGGSQDVKDFEATVLGGIVGVLVSMVLNTIL